MLELGELTAHSSVTTIGRISDSMKVSALTHIMIDLSYRDAKRRSVLNIPETRDEGFGKVFFSKEHATGDKGREGVDCAVLMLHCDFVSVCHNELL